MLRMLPHESATHSTGIEPCLQHRWLRVARDRVTRHTAAKYALLRSEGRRVAEETWRVQVDELTCRAAKTSLQHVRTT
jgi:hypothetical protein